MRSFLAGKHMAEANIISTLIKRSMEISKKGGLGGFILAIKKYYQEYPPLRYHIYYWVKSKTSRSKLEIGYEPGSLLRFATRCAFRNLEKIRLWTAIQARGSGPPTASALLSKVTPPREKGGPT